MRRVHREGLDGTGNGNEAWRTAQRRKQTSYVRNGVLLIERGLAYRKTEETDLCWSATVETGVLFIRKGVAYRKTGPVHPALHGVLFIQPQPARSIGVLFIQRQRHGVLFIHPHRSLFIQSIGFS